LSLIGIDLEAANWVYEDWFEKIKDFLLDSGMFYLCPFTRVAVVCLCPKEMHIDDEGRFHNDRGPAVLWRDGRKEYYLNGVRVDEHIVITPAEKLDPALLLREKNAEVRREIVRKIGIERVVQKLGAKVIDKQGDYELLLLDLQDGRMRPYLKMRNPSIGTYHLEGVPPGIKTVQEALAWRNGREDQPSVLT